jgi:hypothetical protein
MCLISNFYLLLGHVQIIFYLGPFNENGNFMYSQADEK